jgi:hypothetical protein
MVVIPKSRAMKDLNVSKLATRFLALGLTTIWARNDENVVGLNPMKKLVLIALLLLSPLIAFAAEPKAPVLGKPEVVSSNIVRWHFKNVDKKAVAFELWNTISRTVLLRVDDPKATYIDETNIVPADPDMACGRYIVAVNAAGERSFGQVMTYPCVRTPPAVPPAPLIDVIDDKIIKVTVSSGANDPATSIGVYDFKHGAWLSPEHIFVAKTFMKPVGQWGADMGALLIGLRQNSSYELRSAARSVTGEISKWSDPVVVRMPAEKGDAFAPSLAAIGERTGLFGQTLLQTFTTNKQKPTVAGIVNGSGVTITLDDRPYQAEVKGDGEVKSFSFTPSAKLGAGFHYLRLGAIRAGSVAWTPTIEFEVLAKK